MEYPPAHPANALHMIVVPTDQVDNVLQYLPIEHIGDMIRVCLKPEIKEWCIENMRENMAYPRVARHYSENNSSYSYRFYIDFLHEQDAILFKLRWIG